jgi:hypothetical protein
VKRVEVAAFQFTFLDSLTLSIPLHTRDNYTAATQGDTDTHYGGEYYTGQGGS